MNKKQIKVTLIRSTNKCIQSHKDCIRGLGLHRINHSVQVEKTPAIMGMITKVNYLLKVEEV